MLRAFTENKSGEIPKLLRARTSALEVKTTILWKLLRKNGDGSDRYFLSQATGSDFCGDYALEHLCKLSYFAILS